MNYFYLNETLGEPQPLVLVAKGLESVIEGFCKLIKKDKLKIKKGWVIEKETSRVTLAGNFLQCVVNSLNESHRRLFYSFTTIYPVDQCFKNHSDEDLLEKDYVVMDYDATNIAIVALSGGILMSLPLTEWLCCDKITISSVNDNSIIEAHNLYGKEEANIQYVADVLLSINRQSLEGVEKIQSLSLNVSLEDEFVKRFNKSPIEHQKLIVERFEEAKFKQLILPLNPNGTIVKQVNKHVFELRIVNPVDIRVYFYEKNCHLFISSLALKSDYVGEDEQTKDIARIERILSKYDN